MIAGTLDDHVVILAAGVAAVDIVQGVALAVAQEVALKIAAAGMTKKGEAITVPVKALGESVSVAIVRVHEVIGAAKVRKAIVVQVRAHVARKMTRRKMIVKTEKEANANRRAGVAASHPSVTMIRLTTQRRQSVPCRVVPRSCSR